MLFTKKDSGSARLGDGEELLEAGKRARVQHLLEPRRTASAGTRAASEQECAALNITMRKNQCLSPMIAM